MKTQNLFLWLLGLLLMVAAITTFSACSYKDDVNLDDYHAEEPAKTVRYDDFVFFQNALCTIDSEGQLTRYNVGEILHKNESQHLYIGVDNIKEAAEIFATWIAPDVKLPPITPTVRTLTAHLTDTLGRSQGTVYFFAGSGSVVAEVTTCSRIKSRLKYVDGVTFLHRSDWPR